MKNRSLSIDDLEPGDVLLFSPEKGSFISWAITFLTDAPVSHAAMFYDKAAASIIEETPPSVAVNEAAKRFTGREIYVRRMEGAPSLSTVIQAATAYRNDATPYDDTGLYMVGLLLIYKKFSADTPVQKVIIKILKRLTASLTKYINEQRYPGKQPMVCSQFVAQCYDDAGKPYKLIFEDAILQINVSRDAEQNILERVIDEADDGRNLSVLTLAAAPDQAPAESGETLCRELEEAFDSVNNLPAIDASTSATLSDELIEATRQFAVAHYLVNAPGISDRNALTANVGDALQYLRYNQNMFVTPGDLLNNCTNLIATGMIK